MGDLRILFVCNISKSLWCMQYTVAGEGFPNKHIHNRGVMCLYYVLVLFFTFLLAQKSNKKGQQASDYRLLPAGFPDWAVVLL